MLFYCQLIIIANTLIIIIVNINTNANILTQKKERTSLLNPQSINNKIYNTCHSLTNGIKSVIILTNHNNQYYINSFFHTHKKNDFDSILYETILDAIHAKINLANTRIIDNDFVWNKYVNESNWISNNKITDQKIINYYQQIKSNTPQNTRKNSKKDSIEDENKLLIEYSIFYNKMQTINDQLIQLKNDKQIDNYILIGNKFGIEFGYYKADCKTSNCALEMIQGWLNNLSKSYKFSLKTLANILSKWNYDKNILVCDNINHQLTIPDSKISLRLRKGLLYKFPKFGNSFTAHDLLEASDDIEFQRFADDLKLLNPRSYFLAIETQSAYYISLPPDINNSALIALIYLVYARYLNSFNLNINDGIKALTKNIEIDLPKILQECDPENNPLTKSKRPNILRRIGRRTRRFSQAGRNLANYKINDISKNLNLNKHIYNFVISYSMRNTDNHIVWSDSIKNYDKEDMAGIINQICYLFGGVIGNKYDQIWHNFDQIFLLIQNKKFSQIRNWLK